MTARTAESARPRSRLRLPALVALAAVLCCGASARADVPAHAPPGSTAASGETTSNGAGGTSAGASSNSPIYIPDVSRWLPNATSRESLSSSLQILVLMTVLTILPSILLMMTCFVRMIVVLVLLRQALGTHTVPPSQVIVGLAFFMTLLVMAPTWERVNRVAVQPYLNNEAGQMDALAAAGGVMREFMFNQIEAAGNEQDVYMLYEYAARRSVAPDETLSRADVPMTALIPAFMLSELKVAFVIGFRIYLPFLVIDMVIATVLVAMGMMMLPPVLISLPFKLLLFVLADGWHLVAGSLMSSVV
ncbi:MAG: flagellar type III secretion system pore protein FliP [Phycisphaerales bacterium]|nr:flagellar type III secretion system pore protein FliP [Phycisphaerales bacterium]